MGLDLCLCTNLCCQAEFWRSMDGGYHDLPGADSAAGQALAGAQPPDMSEPTLMALGNGTQSDEQPAKFESPTPKMDQQSAASSASPAAKLESPATPKELATNPQSQRAAHPESQRAAMRESPTIPVQSAGPVSYASSPAAQSSKASPLPSSAETAVPRPERLATDASIIDPVAEAQLAVASNKALQNSSSTAAGAPSASIAEHSAATGQPMAPPPPSKPNSSTHKAEWRKFVGIARKKKLPPACANRYESDRLDLFSAFLQNGMDMDRVEAHFIRESQKTKSGLAGHAYVKAQDLLGAPWHYSSAEAEEVCKRCQRNGKVLKDEHFPNDPSKNLYLVRKNVELMDVQSVTEKMQSTASVGLDEDMRMDLWGADGLLSNDALPIDIAGVPESAMQVFRERGRAPMHLWGSIFSKKCMFGNLLRACTMHAFCAHMCRDRWRGIEIQKERYREREWMHGIRTTKRQPTPLAPCASHFIVWPSASDRCCSRSPVTELTPGSG